MEHSTYVNIKERIKNWEEIEKLFIAKCFMTMLRMTPETLSRIRKELFLDICQELSGGIG